MNRTIFNIKLIDWALIITWLLNSLLWFRDPQFMLKTGTSYIIFGIYFTVLFIKIKFFLNQDWDNNFLHLKKQLPLLLYMLTMGLLIHKYLETVYWAPKRQKAFEEIQRKYEERKGMPKKNDK